MLISEQFSSTAAFSATFAISSESHKTCSDSLNIKKILCKPDKCCNWNYRSSRRATHRSRQSKRLLVARLWDELQHAILSIRVISRTSHKIEGLTGAQHNDSIRRPKSSLLRPTCEQWSLPENVNARKSRSLRDDKTLMTRIGVYHAIEHRLSS